MDESGDSGYTSGVIRFNFFAAFLAFALSFSGASSSYASGSCGPGRALPPLAPRRC